jgi:TRAP-type C4-dicarboxylate transport system permease small subunit
VSEPHAEPRGIARQVIRACLTLGSIGLLIAMASDALSVAGRRLGVPFLGSIELVQTCMVLATSSAMIAATVGGGHAVVHIVTERVGPRWRRGLGVIANLISAATFAALAAGSAWLTSDLAGGMERTELLRLPILPLRIFWCASTVVIAFVFLLHALAEAFGAEARRDA